MAKSDSLYDQDFFAWAKQQSMLLREGGLVAADIDHIALEIESMGKAEKRELVSCLTILLSHLLKWQFQPSHRGASWRLSIANARDDITDLLADNPSLGAVLGDATGSAYRRARRQAAAETARPDGDFPVICPYAFEQMMDESFWP
jgi:hypothetical protein